MIVNCPSCTTLYRFDATAGAAAVLARCSRCDEQFDLSPTKRAYAIVETEAAVDRAFGAPEPVRGGAEHWNPPDGVNLGTFDYQAEAEAATATEEIAPAARKSVMGEWLTALFLSTVGGGSGYYLAVLQEADLITFVAGGSAIGLVLGWAVIRWMAREP